MKALLLFFGLAFAVHSATAATTSGTIKEFYVSEQGAIALKLHEGFSQEVIAVCPNSNGYAGVPETDASLLRSALLAAYTGGRNIRLVINECYAPWLRINAVYVDD